MYKYLAKFTSSVLFWVLTCAPYAYAIPIIDLIGTGGSSADFLQVVTQGRANQSEFTNVAQLIANGQGQELIAQGSRVLTLSSNSGLAYEVRGVGHLMLRNFNSAISDFENAARLDPTSSGPLSKLGLVLMETDQLAVAEQTFKLALQVDPNDLFAHRNLGLLYDNLNRPNEAIAELLRGVGNSTSGFNFEATVLARLLNEQGLYSLAIDVLAPRTPITRPDESAQTVLATAMLGDKQWQNALDRFTRAIELNPESTLSRMGQAVALRGMGRFDQSVDVLQNLGSIQGIERQVAVELTLSLLIAGREAEAESARRAAIDSGANPDSLDNAIAQMYLDNQKFDEARDIYQELLDRGVTNAQIYVSLAELYFSSGRIDDAHALLQTGKQEFPNNPFLPFSLGNSYASIGEYTSAVSELNSANALAPNNRDILRALSLAHTRLGNFSEAVTAAESLEQMFPDNLDTLVFLALAYERAESNLNAIATYEKILAIQSENVLALNNLANLLVDSGEYDRALILIEHAARNVPENAVVLDTLGFVRLQLGQYQEALDVFDEAIRLVPELAIGHYHRGLALVQLDRASESQSAFAEALALSPEATWASDANEHLNSN